MIGIAGVEAPGGNGVQSLDDGLALVYSLQGQVQQPGQGGVIPLGQKRKPFPDHADIGGGEVLSLRQLQQQALRHVPRTDACGL